MKNFIRNISVYILSGCLVVAPARRALAGYLIERVSSTSSRAVISVKKNGSVKAGDSLQLLNKCDVEVLKIIKNKALVSTEKCNFDISKEHTVINDVRGLNHASRFPSSTSMAYNPIEIGRGNYILGGVLGTSLGFGVGHGVQGRWMRDFGWIFTLSQLLSASLYVYEVNNYNSCIADNSSGKCKNNYTTWALTFLIAKGIEAISAWSPDGAKYIIAKKEKESSFAASPVFLSDEIGFMIGMTF